MEDYALVVQGVQVFLQLPGRVNRLLVLVDLLKDSRLFILVIVFYVDYQFLVLVDSQTLFESLGAIVPPERIHSGSLQIPGSKDLQIS
jgi:hypothetical protein